MEKLQIYRSQNNIFSGKESTITVRDLLKWAQRLHSVDTSLTSLAYEGYLVLGEKSRVEEDRKFIKQTIEEVTKCKLDLEAYYEDYFKKNLELKFSKSNEVLIFTK